MLMDLTKGNPAIPPIGTRGFPSHGYPWFGFFYGVKGYNRKTDVFPPPKLVDNFICKPIWVYETLFTISYIKKSIRWSLDIQVDCCEQCFGLK